MKWYQKPWVAILFLFLFFPVGLFLMWKYSPWKKGAKIAVTSVVALFGVIGLANQGPSTAPASAEAATSVNVIADSTGTDPTTKSGYEAPMPITSLTTTPPTVALTTKPAIATTITAKPTTKLTTTTKQTTKSTTTKEASSPVAADDDGGNAEYNGRTVYITPSGSKYHYANPCGSGSYSPVTLGEARSRGLEPCDKCVLH